MNVTVKYWGQIKQAAGQASEPVEVTDDCTAQELVLRLANDRGEPLRAHLLDEAGNPRASLLLVVGEEQVSWDSPHRLRDGDVITLLPPISGGVGNPARARA
ncbi:MAG: MoaD/ThiS family protein [Planctomycetota bacterium]|nr:MoaD/ThiS family protein [Planctomycetota bacterium]